jgi:hypothetical protein
VKHQFGPGAVPISLAGPDILDARTTPSTAATVGVVHTEVCRRCLKTRMSCEPGEDCAGGVRAPAADQQKEAP